MKIYTRTGDTGDTALFGGGRVAKDHPRVVAYGTVDELNAVVGWAVATAADATVRERLAALQHDLFAVGAELATPPRADGARHPHLPPFPSFRIEEMERWMDEAEAELPELQAFVLPGGTPGAAALHLARTVCRRAERAVVHLAADTPVAGDLLPYLNRLGDLCFVLARLENQRAGRADVVWEKAAPAGDDPAPGSDPTAPPSDSTGS